MFVDGFRQLLLLNVLKHYMAGLSDNRLNEVRTSPISVREFLDQELIPYRYTHLFLFCLLVGTTVFQKITRLRRFRRIVMKFDRLFFT